MKFTNLTLAIISTSLMATSCVSEDSVIDESNAKNEIKFNVTNEHITRANRYATAADITNFKVSAVLQGTGTYFANESLSLSNGKWVYDSGTTRYWPKSGALDFYALAPSSHSITLNGQTATIEQVVQQNDMNDLIVASSFGNVVGDAKESKQVDLTFTHALAQVSIAAKVPSTLKVYVDEISIVKLNGQAKYSYPITKDGNSGWTKDGTATAFVNREIMKDVTFKDDDSFVALVPTSDAFMVIPFEYPTAKDNNGTCICVKCKMWNVVDGAVGGLVFGEETATKNLYIPVPIKWEMGKRYNYNLSFGTGTAGFDEDGNSSLVKIDWNIDLKDWEGDGDAGNDGNDNNDNKDEDWIHINPGEQTV